MSELLDAMEKAVDDAVDDAFRAQYQDLKAREAWHSASGHDDDFPHCRSTVCRGEKPVLGGEK